MIRGEAGIGKTALLRHVASRGDGAVVLHAEGVEAEMELPFAALHQLCAPLLGDLEGLPPPQREALQSAERSGAGSRPDHFDRARRPDVALERRRDPAARLPRR